MAKTSINLEIAFTHIVTRKKQTLVTAIGVMIGVGIYLFMNSLSAGFTNFSRNEIFKNSPHITIYKDDEMSKSLLKSKDTNTLNIIVNPQITTKSKKIINPQALLEKVKQQPYVTNALSQVNLDVFYYKGNTNIKGVSLGVNILEYNNMFNTADLVIGGNIEELKSNTNGIIIGEGIASKLSLRVDDNITIKSSLGITKVLTIVAIFKSGNSNVDKQRSYINIQTAQQLLKEGPSYVSNILVKTPSPDKSLEFANQLQLITEYNVEDWTITNADMLSQDGIRKMLMGAISLAILFIAAFGIYNILSSTITQKINDIAILKANGFNGRDVVKIFVTEALILGILGTFLGLLFGAGLIGIMSNVWMGGMVGYFPVDFEFNLFVQSAVLGIIITFIAGYFPAKQAANVDPVEIFRQ